MRVLRIALVMSALVGTAACQRDAAPVAARAESVDLSWLDTLSLTPEAPVAASGAELGFVAEPTAAEAAAAAKPVVEKKVTAATTSTRSRAAAPRRSSARSRSSSSSSGTYSAPARQPRVVTVKHTRRDAAIGAAGGAVIGAVAGGSRHRVKGALIGAAVGGIAGAVIGNNVDTEKRVQY